ncbi:DUF349 domain-containing protein [Cryomorphaceae bacterium 1068]|nr:DUF349 domain-containing protein [Cryomorphaceae bacterium 1068]
MKSEILTRLKELASSDDVLANKKEFNELKSQLQNLLDHGIASVHEEGSDAEENNAVSPADNVAEATVEEDTNAPEQTTETIESTEVPKEEVTKASDVETTETVISEDSEGLSEIRKELQELSDKFKEKLKQIRESKAKLEKETVEEARKILAEMKELVAEEENIGKAFARFNEIMEHWKSLPKVSNDDYRELNTDYNKYVEQFFYNINIYKELKELDLKHNLDEKNAVLADQKKLLEENDIRLLEVEVRLNQDRWNEIGPTFKEEWNKIKGEFWQTTRGIYSKIQEFYDGRREEQEENLEAKKQLLEKVRHLESLELKSTKKWQDKSNELIQIQKDWKMIGFVPKAQSSALWKEFKSLCDSFFANKRKHFEELRTVQNENKDNKQALLKQANELKDSEDWKEASHALIQIQQKWKEIGPAHQRDENRLWRQFRESCDEFFKRRNENRAGRGDREKENLQAKEALLAEITAWTPEKGKRNENIAALKDFGEKWRHIGFVPFAKKDEVGAKYKELMDEKYGALDIDNNERKKIRLEEKIETLKESDKSDVLLRRESDHVRNKISKLNSDIIQFENNMGFFAKSKGADKLKEEVEKKIERARKEIEALKEQLSILRDA